MYCQPMSHQHCHQQQTQQIDVNGQIINEREQLRVQLMELEERYHIDIEELKINLLSESERILQKQMNEQIQYYEPQIQQKDQQIQQLTARLQQADQAVHELQSQNINLKDIILKKKDKIKYYKLELENQANFHQNKLNEQENYWRDRLNRELNHQKEQLLAEFEYERKNYQDTILKLKQQLAQFDDKYQQIMFELERLKQQLQEKIHECEEWKSKCKQQEHKLEITKNQPKYEYSPPNNRNLESKIDQLERELRIRDAKLAKRKDKVQTIIQHVPQQVIVEKPIERIVEIERIVPVERIIRERVPARQPIIVNQQQVQREESSDNEEYIEEIKILKRKITELHQQLESLKGDYEDVVEEREQLRRNYDILLNKVHQLEELLKSRNRELQDRIGQLGNKRDDDKIIVHVNQGKTKTSHVLKR